MRVLFSFLLTAILLFANSSFSYERIVSLSPALTEIVVYVGGKEKLVGVTDFCTVNLKAERVGGIVNPNVEKIASLKPDLILATNLTPLKVRETLKLIAPVKVFHLVTLKEIEEAVESIGNLLGFDGKLLRRKFLRELQSSLKGLECLKDKKVFIVISERPLYVAGSKSYIGEALVMVGAVVLPEVSFGAISQEFLLKTAQVVVISSHFREKYFENLLKLFNLTVYSVPPEKLLHPSPYFLEGLRYLGREACVLK